MEAYAGPKDVMQWFNQQKHIKQQIMKQTKDMVGMKMKGKIVRTSSDVTKRK